MLALNHGSFSSLTISERLHTCILHQSDQFLRLFWRDSLLYGTREIVLSLLQMGGTLIFHQSDSKCLHPSEYELHTYVLSHRN